MTTSSATLAHEGEATRTGGSGRARGLRLTALGVGAAMIAFAGSLSAAQLLASGGATADIAAIGLWTFGLTTAAFGTLKLGIASVLLAIIRRVGSRADSLRASLPHLRGAGAGSDGAADPAAVVTDRAPAPLLVHRLAAAMWLPMLAMGAMAVYGGFILSLFAAETVATDTNLAASQRAWVQGLQFLGEGLVLSGISFLLARILGTIRAAGGDVQASLGLAVHTLRMPTTAKAFIVLMMAGLIVSIAQFIGYASIAGLGDAAEAASATALLGPLREFGLGLLLAGIVLALATIARALDFQTDRVVSIIGRGR